MAAAPLSPCLLSSEGQVVPYLLGEVRRTEQETQPFPSLSFLDLLVRGWVCVAYFLPHGWQSGKGQSSPAARASSKDLPLQWRDTVDAIVLLCVCLLQSKPSLGGDVTSFRLGKKHWGV